MLELVVDCGWESGKIFSVIINCTTNVSHGLYKIHYGNPMLLAYRYHIISTSGQVGTYLKACAMSHDVLQLKYDISTENRQVTTMLILRKYNVTNKIVKLFLSSVLKIVKKFK